MIPKTMRAAVIQRFGGPEELTLDELPVPELGANDVLVRVHTSGVGVWDPYEISGGFTSMGGRSGFPYVPGSDASGTVAATGAQASRFREGDRVFASCFLNPKGGSYAEYLAIDEAELAAVPSGLTMRQAGAFPVDAQTAWQGLANALGLERGQMILVFGASGGIGHIGVQLAKRMGATVFAVASGSDGTDFAKRIGADGAVDGRGEHPTEAARDFAPDGYDRMLLTTGGGPVAELTRLVKRGGIVAWPYGVRAPSSLPDGVSGRGYNGGGHGEALRAINELVQSGPFTLNLAQTFPLERAREAVKAVTSHYLGKLALAIEAE